MASISSATKLNIQDIVNSNGWEVPEDVTDCLLSLQNGNVINLVLGDNSVNYTNRSEMIDAWTVENPWSLFLLHQVIRKYDA